MGKSRIGSRARRVLLLLVAVAMVGAVSTTAEAITWDEDGSGAIAVPTADACPTIGTPPPYSTWFNIEDMEQRGYWDGKNPEPWDYSKKLSQVICGAADGAGGAW